jgi:hypothetical protein
VNISVVKNAVGPLDKLLSFATRALWQIGNETYNQLLGAEGPYVEPD